MTCNACVGARSRLGKNDISRRSDSMPSSDATNMSVKHLPPAVKHLLTLRNPGLPAPPSIGSLNSVFKTTFDDAKRKRAEKGWLTLTVCVPVISVLRSFQVTKTFSQTCTLLTANVPSSVGHLYRFTTRSDPDDASTRRSVLDSVNKAALMREAAMKSCIFVGVPRVRAI